MDHEFYNEFLDQARDLGVKEIALGTIQGEPFLHPKCLSFLEAACERGFSASITTNANALQEGDIEALLDLELGGIVVSFAGYDKKSYEGIYCGASFQRASEVIRRFEVVSAAKGKPDAYRVFGVVPGHIGNSHIDYISRTYAFLAGLGVSAGKVVVSRARNFGGSVREGLPSVLHKVRSHMPVDLVPKRVFCGVLANRSPWGLLADGKVTACGCDDGLGRFIIGNLHEESLAAIKARNRLEEHARRFLDDMGPDHPCFLCDTPYSPVTLRNIVLAFGGDGLVDRPFSAG